MPRRHHSILATSTEADCSEGSHVYASDDCLRARVSAYAKSHAASDGWTDSSHVGATAAQTLVVFTERRRCGRARSAWLASAKARLCLLIEADHRERQLLCQGASVVHATGPTVSIGRRAAANHIDLKVVVGRQPAAAHGLFPCRTKQRPGNLDARWNPRR